ncbi:DMT family transporter [Marimonas sp. MJW-29]|uniref:DMT family transporter n=1 Tax=Sulfitobacter sediminis TaxID=3234186 RepID=A0ABV3RJ00_9RHOB
MHSDRPIFGILLMLGFCIVAPMGYAVAKLLSSSVPLAEVVLLRFALQAAILFPLIWFAGRAWRLAGRVFWLALLRTVLHIVGIALMFTALRYLPLADAVAIAFVMPFFMLLLGWFFLGEEVGLRRLLACGVGFLGTLLVVQPSFAEVGWPAILPVLVAANFAVFMLITRQIARETDPIGLQAISGVMAVVLILPVILLATFWERAPQMLILPSQTQWMLLLAIGVLGTLAHLLMTWALQYAPSATLAPMQYLEIPFATVIGLLIFNEIPDPLASLGIAITMAAGLYVILRERATAQHLAAKAAQPTPA